MLRALVSLHEHDAKVLDLKPGNLLFDKGRLYIGDFGLSSVAEVTIGLGRIVALYYRSSTLYQIH